MKKHSLFLLLFSLLILTGFTFPDNTPYLLVRSNKQDEDKIYFNVDEVQYISFNGVQPVNISSHNIFGYCSDNIVITFSPFNSGTYNNGGSEHYYTVYEILENNLYPDNTKKQINQNYNIYVLCLLGGILILCFIKK